jgi:hypothetical protein
MGTNQPEKASVVCNISSDKQTAILDGLAPRWAVLIGEAQSATELRLFFHNLPNLVKLPEIHNQFFETIYFLKNETKSQIETVALEQLHSEIEAIVYREYSDEADGWLRKNFYKDGGLDGLQ